jgi:hypothetical protein
MGSQGGHKFPGQLHIPASGWSAGSLSLGTSRDTGKVLKRGHWGWSGVQWWMSACTGAWFSFNFPYPAPNSTSPSWEQNTCKVIWSGQPPLHQGLFSTGVHPLTTSMCSHSPKQSPEQSCVFHMLSRWLLQPPAAGCVQWVCGEAGLASCGMIPDLGTQLSTPWCVIYIKPHGLPGLSFLIC